MQKCNLNMKYGMIKRYTLSALSLLLFLRVAASDTALLGPANTLIKSHSTLEPISSTKIQTYLPVATFWAFSGSNAVPLQFASKFLTGGYIDPQEMKDYESKLSANNRMGFMQDMSVSVYPIPGLSEPNNELAVRQITVGTMSLGGIAFTKDAFGVVFRGNTPYLGTRKELGTNSYLSLRQRYVDFDIKIPVKAGNWSFSSHVKLSQVLDYQRAETSDMFLFTDANADSVVLGGRFYSQRAGYDFWGTGFGFQVGFSAFRNVNRGFLSISVADLGVLTISEAQTQSRGYTWNADALKPAGTSETKDVNVQSVGLSGDDIKVSNWFDRQRDTVAARLNIKDGVQRGTVLSPFTASINYNKYLLGSKIRGYRMGLSYIHVVGFLPRFSADVRWSPGSNINFTHGISVGGFDTYDINSSIDFNAGFINGNKLMWSIYLRGIESLIVPSEFHGGGIGIQVYYPFGG